jgi:hypothetical protein
VATGQIVEQVAEGFEEAADVTRSLDVARLGFFGAGLAVGFTVGFVMGYRWNREKIRAEEIEKSRQELDQLREFYQKRYATEQQDKPSPEEVVEEKGYAVVVEEHERPLKPPVPVQYPKPRINVDDKSKDEGWDYALELRQRSKNHPYIIHQDEYNVRENEYTQLTWTYYAADNILVDENDEVVVRPELTVGEQNLKRFGHGSDDINVVYIRHDRLEIEWEVCRTLKSHAVEVLGMDPDESNESDEPDESE